MESNNQQRVLATTAGVDRPAASAGLKVVIRSARRLSEMADRNGAPEAQSRFIGPTLLVGAQRYATGHADILYETPLGRPLPRSAMYRE